MAADRPHEFELIQRFFAPLAGDPGSLSLSDDAAVLTPRSGYDLVLTKDVLAADVHFFASDPPGAIAAKALRVNLSDLAAKGAKPRGYLLGLALPKDWDVDWAASFCAALEADQATYAVQLLGGDTISTEKGLQVSITALGEVEARRAVRRSGASSGDLLYVTGTIGDAAAGLKARLEPSFAQGQGLTESHLSHIKDRYLLPAPRTGLAPVLVRYATAAMDISDGLFADAGHLAKASKVGLGIDVASIPLSPALQQIRATDRDLALSCLNGGDDYEILAAVPADKASRFEADAADAECAVTCIGEVTGGQGVVNLREAGQPLDLSESAGFRHF